MLDEDALRRAAAAPPLVADDREMGEIVVPDLVNCAGMLVQPKALLRELSGTEIRSSSSSAQYRDPSAT